MHYTFVLAFRSSPKKKTTHTVCALAQKNDFLYYHNSYNIHIIIMYLILKYICQHE